MAEIVTAAIVIQLEAWEAAQKSGLVSPCAHGNDPDAIDIAQLLGWTLQIEQLQEIEQRQEC